MPTKKQPADSKQLKDEVSDAVDEAQDDAKTGDVATANQPDDALHLRDRRPE